MSGVTKELDILKQLFENLSDTDKQAFLTSVSSKEQVKKSLNQEKLRSAHIANLHISSKMAKIVATNVFCVVIVKSLLLSRQALFSTTRKKTLKFGKNTFIV